MATATLRPRPAVVAAAGPAAAPLRPRRPAVAGGSRAIRPAAPAGGRASAAWRPAASPAARRPLRGGRRLAWRSRACPVRPAVGPARGRRWAVASGGGARGLAARRGRAGRGWNSAAPAAAARRRRACAARRSAASRFGLLPLRFPVGPRRQTASPRCGRRQRAAGGRTSPAAAPSRRSRRVLLRQPLQHVDVLPLDHRPGVMAFEECRPLRPSAACRLGVPSIVRRVSENSRKFS